MQQSQKQMNVKKKSSKKHEKFYIKTNHITKENYFCNNIIYLPICYQNMTKKTPYFNQMSIVQTNSTPQQNNQKSQKQFKQQQQQNKKKGKKMKKARKYMSHHTVTCSIETTTKNKRKDAFDSKKKKAKWINFKKKKLKLMSNALHS